MKKKICFLIVLLSIVFTVTSKKQSLDKNHPKNYTKIPVKFHPISAINPFFLLYIQGRPHILSLDLGLGLPLSLTEKSIEKLKDKETFATVPIQGARAIPVPCEIYKLPYLQIGNYALGNILTMKENFEFRKTLYKPDVPMALILENEKNSEIYRDGSIGWNFFLHRNLMLDLGNKQCFYILENLDQLPPGEKYDLSTFAQAPFTLSKNGILFTVETRLGPKQFLLDNGAVSSIKSSLLSHEKNLIKEKEHYLYYKTPIWLNGADFGVKDLLLSPISDQMEIDGILGYDFCLQPIYLDFQNRIAYIKKTDFPKDYRPKLPSRFWEDVRYVLGMEP